MADVPDDDVVTLPEYQGLLADARSMVVALLEADVTRRPVREGNPPLSQSEIEQFDYWRDKAVKNWNLIYPSLSKLPTRSWCGTDSTGCAARCPTR